MIVHIKDKIFFAPNLTSFHRKWFTPGLFLRNIFSKKIAKVILKKVLILVVTYLVGKIGCFVNPIENNIIFTNKILTFTPPFYTNCPDISLTQVLI